MVYTQLFNLLCEKADDVYGGRLPVHVRCLIDEGRKTKNKKSGESKTAFSVQPEAREIINKYMQKNGKLVFGKYKTCLLYTSRCV